MFQCQHFRPDFGLRGRFLYLLRRKITDAASIANDKYIFVFLSVFKAREPALRMYFA
jgi:hypothetical protein